MINFSLTEKLVQLKDIFVSSPFFFISLIIGIVLLVVMIISIKKNRRIGKIIFVVAWLFVIVFCIVRYFNFFISIFDRLFGRFIEEIYFPSLSIYTVILILFNIILVYSLFNKKIADIFKIINLVSSMTFDLFFIMILDTIVKNNIDIYLEYAVYSNNKLIVLLEFSMFLFVIWILVIMITYFIRKYAIKKVVISTYKEKDYEIINTEDTTIPKSENIEVEFTTDKYISGNTEVIDIEEIKAINKEKIEIIDI